MKLTQTWGGESPPFLLSDGGNTPSESSVSTSGGGGVQVVENTIYYNAPIDEDNVQKFNTELRKLDLELACQALKYGIEAIPIKVHISSGGGVLVYGASAMDNILNCKMPVHTIVDGVCASAATFLSVVGGRRFMYKHSYMMIHQLSSGFVGKFSEFGDKFTNIERLMKFIKDLYIDRTKIPKDELDAILDHDLIWDAKKCLKYGLVDEIIG